MNSVQLAQRLARNLNVPDPFQLAADVALDVLSAMNGGLNAFYKSMPGIYKRTTLSHTIKAPRNLTLTFEAQYSRLVEDDTFELRDQGCTVKFSDGSADNIVTGLNNLLDNYLGTTLVMPAILYSDAIPIQDVIELIIGHVRLYDATANEPTILTREERLRGGRAWRSYGGSNDEGENYYPYNADLRTIGRPRYYYLDPMGVSQSAEPEFLLRIAPLPDKDYTVRMEAELSTQQLVFADLAVPRQIAVTDAYIDDVLVPLCEAELITSPFWQDKTKIPIVTNRQEKAEQKMGKIHGDIAPSCNQVGTPVGF